MPPFTISIAVLPRGIIPRDTIHGSWRIEAPTWNDVSARRRDRGGEEIDSIYGRVSSSRDFFQIIFFSTSIQIYIFSRWNGTSYRISTSRRDVSTDSPLFRFLQNSLCLSSPTGRSGPGKDCLRLINRVEGEILVIFSLGEGTFFIVIGW